MERQPGRGEIHVAVVEHREHLIAAAGVEDPEDRRLGQIGNRCGSCVTPTRLTELLDQDIGERSVAVPLSPLRPGPADRLARIRDQTRLVRKREE
jgi:hypothetical protein